MNGQALGGHRALPMVVLLVGGAAVVGAVWIGGSVGWAVAAGTVYVITAVGAYRWAGQTGDVAAILRSGDDERQRSIDRDALTIAGAAVIVVALVGALVSIARSGDPGAYGAIAAVGGLAYAVALALLRRRR